ncbi:hypothetical protein A5821_001915 [Enterococcus sp. 7F3_DIV0205]|uniref:Uncharacterized protein n=1 Tax=Candidatus Enterococcus palustris TaxID=1834189 RepID=A0AAQ3Y7A3_9ENTE|nr:hypothetical protein [Enterococcus sp. 7F3_DIV0205]OTN82351.1 hypothetical protein A5821_002262 [Enterococcus sp. 7F3_DIV0205]
MVAFFIYWAAILVCIAWGVLSLWFSIYYLSRKENGNLWAFAFFNVLAGIVLAIVLVIYKTWDFDILTYSSLIYTILASYGVLTVLQAILGREPKEAAKA